MGKAVKLYKRVYFGYINESGEEVFECLYDDTCSRSGNISILDDLDRNVYNKLKTGYKTKKNKQLLKGVSSIYLNTCAIKSVELEDRVDKEIVVLKTEKMTDEGLVECSKKEFEGVNKERFDGVLFASYVNRNSTDWEVCTLFQGKPWVTIKVFKKWSNSVAKVNDDLCIQVAKGLDHMSYLYRRVDIELLVKLIEEDNQWCLQTEDGYLKPLIGRGISNLVVFENKEDALKFGFDKREYRKPKLNYHMVVACLSPERLESETLLKVDCVKDIPEAYFTSTNMRGKFLNWCEVNGITKMPRISGAKMKEILLVKESKDEKFLFKIDNFCMSLMFAHYRVESLQDCKGNHICYTIRSLEQRISEYSDDGRGLCFGLFLTKEEAEKSLDEFSDYLCNYCDRNGNTYSVFRKMCLKLDKKGESLLKGIKDSEAYVELSMAVMEDKDHWKDFEVIVDKKSLHLLSGSNKLDNFMKRALKLALMNNLVQKVLNNYEGHKYVVSIWDKELKNQPNPDNSWELSSLEEARKFFKREVRKLMNTDEVAVIDRISDESGMVNMFMVYDRQGRVVKTV